MTTLLNTDYSKRIVIKPNNYHWVNSPTQGVTRMMLDREGQESGRATSIVTFEPGAEFPFHTHPGGEEVFVLDGAFSDEKGHYPAGTYLRNPPGSGHHPKVGSKGTTIFVKLCQFSYSDKVQTVIDTTSANWLKGMVDGLTIQPLHEHKHEHVALVKWAPNTQFTAHNHWGGEEIFVLEGTFFDEHGEYPKGSWLRSPHGSKHQPFTQEDGALIYVKTGHLAEL